MKEIKIKSSNESIYTFNAPTGLPVYMWVNKDKTNVHMTLTVKYGSSGINFTCAGVKYSVPTGTAHYLEHIKFNIKDQDVSKLFYDLGCDSNAYTSLNETSYEVYANTNLKEVLKLLLDFVYDNYFTKKLVDNERGIILEECNYGKDDPEHEFYRRNVESYLPKSTHRIPVIGYEKDIKNITVDDIALIHDFFYRPENMFLTITGNFDKEELEKVINENEKERKFKDIGKIKIDLPKESKKMLEKDFVIESDKCSNTLGKYIIKSMLSDFKGKSKKEVLVSLRALINANFGPTSDFYENVIQNGLATKCRASVTFDDDVVGIFFNVISDNPENIYNLIEEKLNNMDITKEDISRILKKNITSSILRYDNIYEVSGYIISSIIDDGQINDDRFEILKKLTPKKVMDIYKCVDLSNKMTSILKPIKKETIKK